MRPTRWTSAKSAGRLAPYGYRKAPHDHHKLEIDGVTAPVVRRIFEMASEGTGPQEICCILNGEKRPPPSRDRRERGLLRENDDTPFAQYGSRSIVSRILADKVYVGDMVQGKSKKQGNYRVQTPEKDWVCVQNTHEAIISRGQFEKVQTVLRQASAEALQNRSPKIPFAPSLFKGKVFCGHCGFAFKICRQNKDNVYWYRCQTQHRMHRSACYQVSIKETDLRAGAALLLRRYAETLLGQQLKLCKKAMQAAPSAEESAKETQRIQRETERARAQFKALFEALLAERISPGEFATQKQEHEARMAALSGRVLELQTSPRQIQRQVRECWELASCMEAARCEYDLTAELLDSLIERILVYHDKSFEIVWRFSAPFENTEGIPWAM